MRGLVLVQTAARELTNAHVRARARVFSKKKRAVYIRIHATTALAFFKTKLERRARTVVVRALFCGEQRAHILVTLMLAIRCSAFLAQARHRCCD